MGGNRGGWEGGLGMVMEGGIWREVWIGGKGGKGGNV